MGYSYEQALGLVGALVPPHLRADLEVPVLTGVQAQGDLLIFPAELAADAAMAVEWRRVPDTGIALVRSEATGNTHWLHRAPDSQDVQWAPSRPVDDLHTAPDDPARLRLAHLRVPPGQAALLIHTDEHGANGIGPGTYTVHRKREADAASMRLLED